MNIGPLLKKKLMNIGWFVWSSNMCIHMPPNAIALTFCIKKLYIYICWFSAGLQWVNKRATGKDHGHIVSDHAILLDWFWWLVEIDDNK